eukprot:5012044-Amphidinium_carterae.1
MVEQYGLAFGTQEDHFARCGSRPDMEVMLVSYVDDIDVLTTSVENLHTIKAAVTATLASQNMELNQAKTQWCSTRWSDQRLTLDSGPARLAPRHVGLPISGTM